MVMSKSFDHTKLEQFHLFYEELPWQTPDRVSHTRLKRKSRLLLLKNRA